MEKLATFAFSMFAFIAANASESFCELENQNVEFNQQRWGDSVSFNLLFPKSKDGRLHGIQLRYDHIEKFGGHEIFAELMFSEVQDGYTSYINLANDHKPLLIMATYHIGKGLCYSRMYIEIRHAEIHSVRNAA